MNPTLTNLHIQHHLDKTTRLRSALSQHLRLLTKSHNCSYRDFLLAAKRTGCIFDSSNRLRQLRNYFKSKENSVNIEELVAMMVTVDEGPTRKLNRVRIRLPGEFAITIPEVTCEDEEENAKDRKTQEPHSGLGMYTTRSTRLHGTPSLMDKTNYSSRSRIMGCLEADGPISLVYRLKSNYDILAKKCFSKEKTAIDFQQLTSIVVIYFQDFDRPDLLSVFNLLVDEKTNLLTQQGFGRLNNDTQKLCFEIQTIAQMKERHLSSGQMKIRPRSIGQLLVFKSRKPSILNIGTPKVQDDSNCRPMTSLTIKVKPRLRHFPRKLCPKEYVPIQDFNIDQQDLLKRINKRVPSRLKTPDLASSQSPRLTITSHLRTIFNQKILRNLSSTNAVKENSLRLSPKSSKLNLYQDIPF